MHNKSAAIIGFTMGGMVALEIARKTPQLVDRPTLIIGSSHDELCPVKEQIRMHQLVKDSSLEIIQDCGHFSLMEQPALVNEAIRNWYESA